MILTIAVTMPSSAELVWLRNPRGSELLAEQIRSVGDLARSPSAGVAVNMSDSNRLPWPLKMTMALVGTAGVSPRSQGDSPQLLVVRSPSIH